MATPLNASQMLTALKAEGVTVLEYRDWRTHNRNSAGQWGPVNGLAIHHTAGTNSLETVYNGRSDLPGPLAHAHLSKAGLVSLTASGRANHFGTMSRLAFEAMRDETGRHPAPLADENVDGNRHLYGLEIENLGNNRDPYPAVQYDQAVRWAAAICRAHGWGAHSVIGHKEGTRRKIDPTFSMSVFRSEVAMRLKNAASWNPSSPPSGGTTVALTKGDVKIIVKTDELIKSPDHLLPEITNKFWTLESYLYETYRLAREAKQSADANGVKLDALIPLVLTDEQVVAIGAALAVHPGIVDAIAEAVAQKVADRLAD